MKAIIYARQSSGSDDISESVENQIANCKKQAEKENYQVIGIFSDLNTSGKTYPEGAESIAENDSAFLNWYDQQTGTKKYRHGLGEVIKLLDQADVLIIDEMTRLYRPVTRSFLESYVNQKITEANVKIIQVKGGKLDLSQFDQSLIQMLKNAIQDEAIANQKAKAKQQFQKLRDNGYLCNGARAFGLKYLGNKRIEVDSEAAKCIKFVFESIAAYRPYNQIIKEANQRFRHLFPKCFYSSNLYHIAENPLYCGLLRNTEGQLVKAVQLEGQEVVSYDLWQTVQRIINRNREQQPRRAKKHWLPFSGKLHCGNCGSRLVCINDKGKIIYWCKSGYYTSNSQCSSSRIRFIGTDKEFGLYQCSFPFFIIAMIERQKKAIAIWEDRKQYDSIKMQIDQIETNEQSLIDLVFDGIISADELKERLKKHKVKKLELQEKLRSLEMTTDDQWEDYKNLALAEELDSITECHLPNQWYEQYLNQVIDKITINYDCITYSTIYGECSIPRLRYKNRNFLPQWEVSLLKELNHSISDYNLIDGQTKFLITFKTGTKQTLADWGRLIIQTL